MQSAFGFTVSSKPIWAPFERLMEYTLEMQQQLLSDHSGVVFMRCQGELDNGLILKYVSENRVWMCFMTESLKSGQCYVKWVVKIFLFTIVHCLCLIFGCYADFIWNIFNQLLKHGQVFSDLLQKVPLPQMWKSSLRCNITGSLCSLLFFLQVQPSSINYSKNTYLDTVISPLVCREATASGSPRWCYRDPWRCRCHWTHRRCGCYCFHGPSAAAEDPHGDG